MTDTGFIKSRHLDDKVSAAVLLNLLRVYKEEQIQLPVTTTFAFSVFEEVGHGANSSIPAEVVEYLAVDMGAMAVSYTHLDVYKRQIHSLAEQFEDKDAMIRQNLNILNTIQSKPSFSNEVKSKYLDVLED